MKLAKLLLQAFGPFTDATLDFSAGPANLHLIYGPNEAGKSSALRAMTDLRFGIPARSPDDFVHPFSQMRIAGVFLDGQGEAIALARRKGSKATLSRLDVANLQPNPDLLLQPGDEAALSGGLGRAEFEAMFGLNHARLREGGDLLLKGEGELGSALFEASAGVRGIAAMLAELDADAKKLLNPHAAAKSAVINEARRQLDEQRLALRQAQTKPAEWHSLHRAHDGAKAALDEIGQTLEAQRRLGHGLTELRTVAPLLREHELLLAECAGLASAPDLPEDAREQRLSAEQALRHAEQDCQDAEADIARCVEALDGLAIEPTLLEQAEFIERLAAGAQPMAHRREDVRELHITLVHLQHELDAAASRIGVRDGAALARPSAAERAELNHHLDAIATLGERLSGLRQQAGRLRQALRQNSEDAPTLPAISARRALAARLRQAQGLGDVARLAGDGERQIRELSGQITQALADLGLDSVDALRAVRPLLDATLTEFRQELLDIAQHRRSLVDEDERLRRDLEEQGLRQRQLAAAGEVVTADTLRQARAERDEGWRQVRQVYVEQAAGDPGRDLADSFEARQAEADRQADLLRADAERAAWFEECATRIGQMRRRQDDIAAATRDLDERAAALRADWSHKLAQAGLPTLSAEALREWQAQRLEALHLAERHAAAKAALAQLQTAAQQAASELADALKAFGHPAEETAADLPALLEQAAAWDKAATEAQAKHEERVKAAQAQAADLAEIERQSAEAEAAWQRHHTSAQDWHSRLLLNPDSPPDAVKARLEELDAYARQAAALADAKLRLAQGQAALDEFNAAARQLADLLHEPAPAQADDFAENLRKRLSLSQQAETQRKSLRLEVTKAEKKLRQAQAGHATQAAALARLCHAADVADRADLPTQEALAAQKRLAQENLNRLCQQLRQASVRTEAELRQALADRDAIRLDTEREQCKAEIARLEQEQTAARQAEEQARRALEAIDASDAAARAREAMESAAARHRAALKPWARLRLAHALLAEALLRFRERAQAPMVQAASAYFELMTGGRYGRLLADEQDGKPVLRALRNDGARIGVEAMSEGTADQLYLALRLAALELRRASHPPMPLVLDDVLITSDDQRAVNVLRALAKFAEGGQVMLFTHHRHVLDLAGAALGAEALAAHWL